MEKKFMDEKYKTEIYNDWVVTFTKIDHEIEISKNKKSILTLKKWYDNMNSTEEHK